MLKNEKLTIDNLILQHIYKNIVYVMYKFGELSHQMALIIYSIHETIILFLLPCGILFWKKNDYHMEVTKSTFL